MKHHEINYAILYVSLSGHIDFTKIMQNYASHANIT